MDYLKNSFLETNESQKTADKMAQEISTGKSENIHETMLALSHAELNFNFMVQVRNKVVESYQEIMRMQV
jgi:flagellar hook-basal body complex protein FliE